MVGADVQKPQQIVGDVRSVAVNQRQDSPPPPAIRSALCLAQETPPRATRARGPPLPRAGRAGRSCSSEKSSAAPASRTAARSSCTISCAARRAGSLLRDIERDGAYPRVAASAVALANFGQIHGGLGGRPGIRAHRNLHPETALAEAYAVDRLGMQIVGNKFVVAFQIVVGNIEKEGADLSIPCAPSRDAMER